MERRLWWAVWVLLFSVWKTCFNSFWLLRLLAYHNCCSLYIAFDKNWKNCILKNMGGGEGLNFLGKWQRKLWKCLAFLLLEVCFVFCFLSFFLIVLLCHLHYVGYYHLLRFAYRTLFLLYSNRYRIFFIHKNFQSMLFIVSKSIRQSAVFWLYKTVSLLETWVYWDRIRICFLVLYYQET